MTSKRHVMFGFFKNVIRVTVIIFAIIGFIAIGGLSFIQKHFNFESGKNQDSKIEKAEKISDERVRFYFRENTQNKELPMILAQFKIFPKKDWETRDFAKPSLRIPLGNGPYKIKSFHI